VTTALVDYSKTPDGKTVLKALFAWDGMQEVNASFYDAIREAVKLSGIDVQGLANATPRPAATPSPSKTP
jgi:ABC-type phosphate/phosphonate transport system substrate-binding protein